MKYLNGRTKTLVTLLAFFSIFLFSSGAPWNKFWVLLVAIIALLLLIDVMFLSSDQFELDPFYSNWEARQSQTAYN
ncbi:hypothetical protein X943_001292 [Babesia divergens]|uniref:Uncharacterized protein n=1 Tax=Babesia divergens TaxID=32595 RepID=A0AAD9GFA4_BABDI|nr:hypothetical protein X943_001292 [Babesia divergens]